MGSLGIRAGLSPMVGLGLEEPEPELGVAEIIMGAMVKEV